MNAENVQAKKKKKWMRGVSETEHCLCKNDQEMGNGGAPPATGIRWWRRRSEQLYQALPPSGKLLE